MTYAHHGQIRCYTFRLPHSRFGRWDAHCRCGWSMENFLSWESALANLRIHQRICDPRWMVFVGPVRAPLTARATRDALDAINETPLQRAHNSTARRNQ